MANAPAVVAFWNEFRKRHMATAPAKYKNDLILAGMTYNKGGYHSTRDWLRSNKPGDYSIQRAADKTGPSNVGAALDVTFKSAQRGDYTMIKMYTNRAKAGLRDKRVYAADGNTNTFRELIGTLDGRNPHSVSFYRETVTVNGDRSHMWHIHFSFTRKWLNDFSVYEPLLDMLFPTYTGSTPAPAPEPEPRKDEFDMATLKDLRDAVVWGIQHYKIKPGEAASNIGKYSEDLQKNGASLVQYAIGADCKGNAALERLDDHTEALSFLASKLLDVAAKDKLSDEELAKLAEQVSAKIGKLSVEYKLP